MLYLKAGFIVILTNFLKFNTQVDIKRADN